MSRVVDLFTELIDEETITKKARVSKFSSFVFELGKNFRCILFFYKRKNKKYFRILKKRFCSFKGSVDKKFQ